ncbi:MAG TPA: OsmC family protein [Ohtaekwangia sp.]|uniref:OsmC family protein n=1 Tax=Ohtaekwangia sp. TaxID=2066019 RepID=UPI002F92C6A6
MIPEKTAIATIGKDAYATQLETTSHTLTADEPVADGGKDLGPQPTDFLRMSLASCTAITLRMYADRKGMNVEKIKVTISTETIDNKTVFHRSVEVTGAIDDEQRKRLLHVANSCPVHKILTNPIEVQTQLS